MDTSAAVAAWETNAKSWDAAMGSTGNDYYKVLELPVLERMVQVKSGERALDLATGNGLVAHWLARAGAKVIATDGCRGMLDFAEKRGKEASEAGEMDVEYRLLDVTDAKMWNEFVESEVAGGGKFDIITMNMAIMDVPTLEPLATAIPKLLKKDGRFVATLLHPFMAISNPRLVEFTEDPETGAEKVTRFLKVKEYLHVPPVRSLAVQGQPVGQVTFHRPLHELFAAFFRAELVLDALEEPNFDDEYVRRNKLDPGSWRAWTQVPKILAFRMRMAAARTWYVRLLP